MHIKADRQRERQNAKIDTGRKREREMTGTDTQADRRTDEERERKIEKYIYI